MTIEQVEPLKFKGNKTWYLHKLSEKGADALKTKFPDGNGGEVETTIQAAIDELATNGGGGGSAESLIPKRVIYINPDKETVAGECYPTFAAAKTYMETYPEQKFCVELPAGDFGTTADDHITLSEQWEIHGNNTKIVAPIDTKIVETGNMQGLYNMNRCIQNCTISGGFVGDSGATGLKCYRVYSSIITNMNYDEVETNTAFLFANDCEIDCDAVPMEYLNTSWYSAIFKNCMIKSLYAKNTENFLFFNCFVLNLYLFKAANFYSSAIGIRDDVSRYNIYCESGEFEFYESNVQSTLVNCNGIDAHNSSIGLTVSENKVLPTLRLDASSFDVYNNSGGVLTVTTLWNNAISKVFRTANLSAPVSNENIVYSTDGGTTMSNDPTDATHYGVCKDLTATLVDASNYMWFAIPVGE